MVKYKITVFYGFSSPSENPDGTYNIPREREELEEELNKDEYRGWQLVQIMENPTHYSTYWIIWKKNANSK